MGKEENIPKTSQPTKEKQEPNSPGPVLTQPASAAEEDTKPVSEDGEEEEKETDYFKIHYDEDGNWKTHEWSTGMCDCCKDKYSCICGLFFPWFIACQIAEKMQESKCVPTIVPGGIIAMRTKLRQIDHIRGSICDDFCCVYFCCPLIICQMYRHAFKDFEESKLRYKMKKEEEAKAMANNEEEKEKIP